MPKKERKDTNGQFAPTKHGETEIDTGDLLNSFGGSGTKIVEGFIEDDYNTSMAGQEGAMIYDEMRRTDAQVNAVLLAMELPIRSTRWHVKPAEDAEGEVDDLAREVADFVENNLFDQLSVTFDDLLREILTMLPFGYSVFEKVYGEKDGKIIVKKIAFRKQTTILKRQTLEGTPGVTQQLVSPLVGGKNDGLNQVSIPQGKLLLFSYRREGDNYEGISALRSAYKHWYIKDKLYKFDAVKQERQSIGLPVVTLPETATKEEKADAKQIVQNVRANEKSGVVLPGPGWKIEMLDMGSSGTSDLFESIKHHNREIAKNILAQFLELGDTSSGSRSLGESQIELFLQSLNAIAKQVADTFNRFIIGELVDLNYNVTDYPKLAFDKIEVKDVQKFASTLASLVGAELITPDEDLEDHLRETLGLPARMAETPGDIPAKSEEVVPAEDRFKIPKDKENKMSEGHDHQCGMFDEDYFNIGKLINNKHIIRLQNEVRDQEDISLLKKKGFRFNEFESSSWRPLTFAERKVNFTSLSKSLDTFEEQLNKSIEPLIVQMKDDLLSQIKKAVENNDIEALGNVQSKMTGDLAQVLTDIQKEMFEVGKKSAAAEIGVPVPSTKAEVRGAMRIQNDAIVSSIINDIETQSKTATLQLITKHGGSISATNAAEAVGVAQANLDKVFEKATNAMKSLTLTGSVNLGRSSIFERYPEKIHSFQFSAILDGRTTDTCRSLDGRVVRAGSSDFYKYSPPLHYGCRSIWVEILVEEIFKPDITGIPSSIPVPQSLETFKDLKAPIILKGSPVVKVLQQEIDDRKAKIAEIESTGKYENRLESHQARVKELENAIKNAFNEMTREILEADGIKFK